MFRWFESSLGLLIATSYRPNRQPYSIQFPPARQYHFPAFWFAVLNRTPERELPYEQRLIAISRRADCLRLRCNLCARCGERRRRPAAAQTSFAIIRSSLRGKLTPTGTPIYLRCNADGSNLQNLTHTPGVHEHYPQVSPDGTKIVLHHRQPAKGATPSAASGSWTSTGRTAGKSPTTPASRSGVPDGKVIGYLPQEYPKFDVIDYYTKGMMYYHLDTGKSEPHPNATSSAICITRASRPTGNGSSRTVHGGMGFSHTILLIEAHGDKIIDLKIPGCRPTRQPRRQAHRLGFGRSRTGHRPASIPIRRPRRSASGSLRIQDEKNKIYHIAWSPDGKFVAFSRGPDGEGDLTKPGTFTAACEIIGVYAEGLEHLRRLRRAAAHVRPCTRQPTRT